MNIIDIPWWVKALIVLAIAGAVYGAIVSYGNDRYAAGKDAEKADWIKRENTELITANAEISRLTTKARQTEQDHATAIAKASGTYQEALNHEKTAHARTVADLRAGVLKLRIDLARRESTGGSTTAQTGAGPGGCDGETRGELSQQAGEFLVGLASEADEVVRQLTACQAVVDADRKINTTTEGDPEK